MNIIVGFAVGVVVTLVAVGIYCISNVGFDFDFDFGDMGNGGKMR
jgi:hypothetical protein